MHITIEALDPSGYPLVNRFYRDLSYPAKAGRDDIVWVARQSSSIVGALVLVPQGDVCMWLRGMVVAPSSRAQGVGAALLQQCLTELVGVSCYCFPFVQLQAFYQQAGFRVIESDQLPTAYLRGAFSSYCQQGKSLLAMVYP